ncbi:YihY/virulence factor BrkB family protein [Acidobacteria bacterium AB60]|nr:YihY/virulence factor BrkB family protein [Acidobacteria bacterium AB60]
MASVSNSGTIAESPAEDALRPEVPECTEVAPPVTVQLSKWYRLRHDGTALVKYLLDSEVHTFAFSVAANAILSFIPLVVLLYTLALSVFHSQAMAGVVSDLVANYFPSTASMAFWGRLRQVVPGHVQAFSLLMILISCTGIFLPLEVALNQAWGVAKSRNYLLNQLVAFGLAIIMVALGIISIWLGAAQRQVLAFLMFHKVDNWFYNAVSYSWLAVCSGTACILFFFSIYWLLPNCKVPWRPVLRASIVTGIIWLVAKYIFTAMLPHMDLSAIYGPFYVSVGLLFWAYISGLILFAGAQYSVKQLGPRDQVATHTPTAS